MKLHLVEFLNTDSVVLPGLLFEPNTVSDSIVICLHGNGSSGGMYSVELQNMFGKTLTDNEISYLTFTNTGGHLIQKFNQIRGTQKTRVTLGSAYELIRDCVKDINGAVHFVKNKGYKHIYLIGASTGANKICVYNYYNHSNDVEKYVLLSGGDDSGLYYDSVGDERFRHVLDLCESRIKSGKGRNFVPKYLSEMPISFQSLYDQINPDGDYNTFPFYWELNKIKIMKKEPFRELKGIDKPTLVLYGSDDEFCYGRVFDCVGLLKKELVGKSNFRFEIIPNADHSFFGKRSELAKKITSFLAQ
jgi:pimeloyl-ACP methyl ester carboxylesterase